MCTRAKWSKKSLLDRLVDALKGIICFIEGASESARRHDVRPLARMGLGERTTRRLIISPFKFIANVISDDKRRIILALMKHVSNYGIAAFVVVQHDIKVHGARVISKTSQLPQKGEPVVGNPALQNLELLPIFCQKATRGIYTMTHQILNDIVNLLLCCGEDFDVIGYILSQDHSKPQRRCVLNRPPARAPQSRLAP